MRTVIKMILLQAAKGLGKAGEEIEVATPEQAEYFEEKGIATRDPDAGSSPVSDNSLPGPDLPAASPGMPPQPPSSPKKQKTRKHEKDI